MTPRDDAPLRASVRRLSAVLVLLACSKGAPTPLVAGQDACEFCRMAITDVRFGGEVVLTTGRHYTFDSIECLASFLAAERDPSRVSGVWVSDYGQGRLVDAASAVFVRGGTVNSPMGRALVAFAGLDTTTIRAQYGGTLMDWEAVRATIRVPGPAERQDTHADSSVPPLAR